LDDLLNDIYSDANKATRKQISSEKPLSCELLIIQTSIGIPSLTQRLDNFTVKSEDSGMDILEDLLQDIKNSKVDSKSKSKAVKSPTAPVGSKKIGNDDDIFNLDDLFDEPMLRSDKLNPAKVDARASASSAVEPKKGKQPQIEDFASFQEYLNALVSFEKSGPSDSPIVKPENPVPKKPTSQPKPKTNEDFFDDEFMALFGDSDDEKPPKLRK
jgi:hypothetical protein